MPTLNSIYEQAEIDILSLLGNTIDLTNSVIGAPLPDNQAAFRKGNEKPVIWVSYLGSEYGDNIGMGTVAQEEHAHFEVIIKYKNRRGVNGIYQLEQKTQFALLGNYTTNFEKFTVIKKNFLEYVENEWHYQMVFRCLTVAVQQADQTDPALTNVPFQELIVNSTYTYIEGDINMPELIVDSDTPYNVEDQIIAPNGDIEFEE